MSNERTRKENQMLLDAHFKHLKFTRKHNDYVATLTDNQGYEIVKGYGATILEAINDLHSTLI